MEGNFIFGGKGFLSIVDCFSKVNPLLLLNNIFLSIKPLPTLLTPCYFIAITAFEGRR